MSPPGEESRAPLVAMNAVGEAVAVWVHLASQSTIKTASRTPQGTWGAVEEIPAPGVFFGHVDIAIDSAGRAAAIWSRQDNTLGGYIIEAATRSSAGQWAPAVPLSEPGGSAYGPKLAVDPSGRLVATWYAYNDDGDSIVQAAEKEPGKAWSEPENLSTGGANAFSPKVAVSAERAVVVWERDQVVEAATREAGGVWQAPVEISEPGSREPAIGMDSGGNALTVWTSGPEIYARTVEAASLPLAGVWTEPITLSERISGEGALPQVAIDPVGQAMAVWTAWDGTASVVEAASRTAGGAWKSPVTISPPGSWSHRAKIAIDSTGNAAAVWREADSLTMQAAVFDVTKPELGSVSIPPLARAGRPVSFTASPFDAWSLVGPLSWTFGDTSTAVGSAIAHSFQEAGQFHVTVSVTDAAGHTTTAAGNVSVTPALATSGRIVTVRNGKASLKLHCPGTAVCHGGAGLTRQVVSKKGRRHSRMFGEAGFAIPGETQMTVSVKLKPKSLTLISSARKKGLPVQLAGDAVESRTVILKRIIPKSRFH